MTVAAGSPVLDSVVNHLACHKDVVPTAFVRLLTTVSFLDQFYNIKFGNSQIRPSNLNYAFLIFLEPQCSCPDNTIPNPTPLVGCVREPKVCSGNRDCAEGYFCESGSCLPICSSNVNCFSNEICDKGLCKPVCRVDGDCRNGEVCDGLSCIPGCRSDDACLDSQVCSGNKCTVAYLDNIVNYV